MLYVSSYVFHVYASVIVPKTLENSYYFKDYLHVVILSFQKLRMINPWSTFAGLPNQSFRFAPNLSGIILKT